MGAKLTFDILRDIKTHHSILPSFVATIVTISFLYVLGFFETKVAAKNYFAYVHLYSKLLVYVFVTKAATNDNPDHLLTIIPVVTAMPLPQYVLGTISP